MQRQDVRRIDCLDHGREIFLRIERQFGVKARIDRERSDRAHQDRVAVGIGADHQLGRDVAGSTGAVVHDDLLAHHLAHFGRDRPGGAVGAAAGREAHDHADGFVRIGVGGECAAERQCRADDKRDALQVGSHGVLLAVVISLKTGRIIRAGFASARVPDLRPHACRIYTRTRAAASLTAMWKAAVMAPASALPLPTMSNAVPCAGVV